MGYVRVEPREFFISKVVPALKLKHCWLRCGEVMYPGDQIAVCEWGPGAGEWDLAHEKCAEFHPLNAQKLDSAAPSTSGDHAVVIEQVRRGDHRLLIDGVEVLRSTNFVMLQGAMNLLVAYPDAMDVVLADALAGKGPGA